jgi:uncharacterized protein YbgA (DUF1722 family)/uncharacterized protein YbbK (DUF523 family)
MASAPASRTAMRLGISSCLLGESVRYDGGHKLDRYLRDTLGEFVEWVPVCPEVECGLPVPREAMRLVGDPAAPRLVTVRSGVDHTEPMTSWAFGKLDELDSADLAGFVFKGRSPSSGLRGVRVYDEKGNPSRTGMGLFARAFTERFPLVPAEDDGRLSDPGIRDGFIERVFVYRRWLDALARGSGAGALVDFHTDHKLQLMAHGPAALRELGALVASAKGKADARMRYAEALMRAMDLPATAKKQANALQHAMGWLKRRLSPADKAELLEAIDAYRLGRAPLLVPVTLLRHHVRILGEPYLERQTYLNPSPEEMRLRWHA